MPGLHWRRDEEGHLGEDQERQGGQGETFTCCLRHRLPESRGQTLRVTRELPELPYSATRSKEKIKFTTWTSLYEVNVQMWLLYTKSADQTETSESIWSPDRAPWLPGSRCVDVMWANMTTQQTESHQSPELVLIHLRNIAMQCSNRTVMPASPGQRPPTMETVENGGCWTTQIVVEYKLVAWTGLFIIADSLIINS